MRRRNFLALTALPLAGQQGPSFIQDGEAHGDPPFLQEPGWTPLLNGRDLSGWSPEAGKPSEWYTSKAVRFERLLGPTRLGGTKGESGVIMNGPAGRTANLVTNAKHGDIELYLEFMLAKGSNSGVYLQGLYEIQIFDSYASSEPLQSSDAGGIYHRWINEQGVGGSAPLRNAARRPGEWQSYQAWFRAPRFDAAGKKIANAKFLRVLHNGLLVQQDVECEGPTRSAMNHAEAPENPLMLQGDHGPVAFRNLHWRPLRPLISR
ncbi:MAG: DUF1080 domain-containing protein [Bryobacteraceae bacterium]|nr:DUF1080 domain-containing protein [Bryobacteraceae bacterium]